QPFVRKPRVEFGIGGCRQLRDEDEGIPRRIAEPRKSLADLEPLRRYQTDARAGRKNRIVSSRRTDQGGQDQENGQDRTSVHHGGGAKKRHIWPKKNGPSEASAAPKRRVPAPGKTPPERPQAPPLHF